VRVQWELLTTSAPIFYQRINSKIHEDFDVLDSTERVALNGTTDELFVAYIMVVGADTDRFGQLIERLQQSYSVGNNNYPLTINDAKLYLERTEDNKTSNKKKESSNKKQFSTIDKSSKKEIDEDEKAELSFSQIRSCDVCGKKGHSARRCYFRNATPKDKWHKHQLPSEKEQASNPTETNLVQTEAWYAL
jgi:hypothetical protein